MEIVVMSEQEEIATGNVKHTSCFVFVLFVLLSPATKDRLYKVCVLNSVSQFGEIRPVTTDCLRSSTKTKRFY